MKKSKMSESEKLITVKLNEMAKRLGLKPQKLCSILSDTVICSDIKAMVPYNGYDYFLSHAEMETLSNKRKILLNEVEFTSFFFIKIENDYQRRSLLERHIDDVVIFESHFKELQEIVKDMDVPEIDKLEEDGRTVRWEKLKTAILSAAFDILNNLPDSKAISVSNLAELVSNGIENSRWQNLVSKDGSPIQGTSPKNVYEKLLELKNEGRLNHKNLVLGLRK